MHDEIIYLRSFRSVCDPKGGPDKIPVSYVVGYRLRKAGLIKTVKRGSRTLISNQEIARVNRAIAAGTLEARA